MAMIKCAECGHSLTPGQRSAPCPNCGGLKQMIIAADEAAKELANLHYEVEAGLTHIFLLNDKAEARTIPVDTIRLLEVNDNTAESGVMPLYFGPAPASGIPFSSIIIEVTPDEFKKIQSNELKLPNGWEIGEEVPRPSGVGGGV
jgi:predicted RNA-binding Zn-ribbon protein involved in translation (DUF1610 family)